MDQQEELRQEFLALPKEQWSGKAFRVVGEYMKVSGMAAKHPDKVWDDALASLKGVLLELGRQDIYNDVADWLQRTCKPYWDGRKRDERAAKAAQQQAALQKPENVG
jgi:hypothetical protein